MTRTLSYRGGFPQRRPDVEPGGGARRATGQHPRTIRCNAQKPLNIERAVSTCEGAKEPMLFQRKGVSILIPPDMTSRRRTSSTPRQFGSTHVQAGR
jgi:hypothetical protein